MRGDEHFDDPVAAYDRLSPHYAEFSRGRERYLKAIDEIVVSRIPPDSESLLDVGGGDGRRGLRIAKAHGIQRIVVAEPSRKMAAAPPRGIEIWNVRAEDLEFPPTQHARARDSGAQSQASGHGAAEQFDVITCLWNVLGHIQPARRRQRAIQAIARRLSEKGRFFLDVNHRYNLRAYGATPTAARWLRDLVFSTDATGDVVARWKVSGGSISTPGHVFTDREIRDLARRAGLNVEARIAVDYETGAVRKFSFQGSLLYILRRT